MSKNIYRVNKKTDLDEIMKNNMYKPICICFLSKSLNNTIYEDLTSTLLTISKLNTYMMNIIIDFDNFTDDFNGSNGYFDSIKNNTPYFMAFFKGKIIAITDNSENFIPIVINHLEKIHETYIGKLSMIFDNPNPNPNHIPNQNINNNLNGQINNRLDEELDNNMDNDENDDINDNNDNNNINIHNDDNDNNDNDNNDENDNDDNDGNANN